MNEDEHTRQVLGICHIKFNRDRTLQISVEAVAGYAKNRGCGNSDCSCSKIRIALFAPVVGRYDAVLLFLADHFQDVQEVVTGCLRAIPNATIFDTNTEIGIPFFWNPEAIQALPFSAEDP